MAEMETVGTRRTRFAVCSAVAAACGAVLFVALAADQAPALGPSFQFQRIEPGEFVMGSNDAEDEKPPHTVRITTAFEIGRYEATQSVWEAVMGSNPARFPYRGADRPIVQVTWREVQGFFEKLNARQDGYRYRLPTEAEWEYAARAGAAEQPANLDAFCWHSENCAIDRMMQTHPVGQKRPNAWGLFDMQGNVWEMCQDWYDATYYARSPRQDPPGPETGTHRVVRGGSIINSPKALRVSMRRGMMETIRVDVLGFRCVRTPVGQ